MIQITSATKSDIIGGAGGHSKKLECKLEGANNGFKRNQSAGARARVHPTLVPN